MKVQMIKIEVVETETCHLVTFIEPVENLHDVFDETEL